MVQDDVKANGGKRCSYNLILMDCIMPVCDGFKSSNLIREFLYENNIDQPIIVAITAQSAQDCLQKVYTAGMNAYSVKPCNPDNLRAICTQMGFINDNWAQGDLDGEEDIDDD